MIEGRGLTKIFTPRGQNRITAVDGVDIRINSGETLALVGESGCGKSTLSRLLLLLIPPTQGEVFFEGQALTGLKQKELRLIRRKIQIVPQQPESALNPRWKIADSICEPFRIHPDVLPPGKLPEEELEKLLELVGLEPEQAARYPHQLSGGELQRAVIARAIALEPALIICDEPTSMLDVSTQAAIVRLLQALQHRLGCALLFITHDQGLAHAIGDRTAVMFGGQIVEEGQDVLDRPLHPFTRKLTSIPDSASLQCPELQGNRIPGSCVYYRFCPEKTKNCLHSPELKKYDDRKVRCHNISYV
ncbi:TPA: ABC transporter ATP-binding protein [Methanosarcina acetivorans]|nr:ABC transporter ATP-binding protein [Methanosarcina acetivorans]HIH94979.1 ABC transporter ATP-binding protein [Methanosarcina acetivorans]